MDRYEHKWRFALLAVFVLLIVGQSGFFLLKLNQCNTGTTPSPACDKLLEKYQDAVNSHLQTILALMVGAGAAAAGAGVVLGDYQKRHPPEPPQFPDVPPDRPLVRRHPDEDL
jgi:ABC-type Co2+ transport system permease subunit